MRVGTNFWHQGAGSKWNTAGTQNLPATEHITGEIQFRTQQASANNASL